MKVRNLAKASVLSLALLTGCAKEAPNTQRTATQITRVVQSQPKSFATRMYELTGLNCFREDANTEKKVTNDFFDSLIPPEKRLKEDHWFSQFAGNVKKFFRKIDETFKQF